MKKNLLFLTFFAGSVAAWGQNINFTPFTGTKVKPAMHQGTPAKSITCNDTLRYQYIKQAVLGNPTQFSTGLDIEQSTNDAVSQTFLHSGASMSISGVEIWALNGYDGTVGTPSVTVRASIYAVDASNVPTTSLGSGTAVITDNVNDDFYIINLTTPVTVTGNYAVVIDVTTPGGILTQIYTDPTPNQAWDENFARFKSSAIPTSAGLFVTMSALTNNTYNFEPVVSPIVSYTYTASATATPNPSCLGTAVTFSGSSNFTGNRMNNYNLFRTHFGTAVADSTFAWDMGGTIPIVWDDSHSYTYAAAGTYNPEFYTLGGFWEGCVDFTVVPVTVNALPVVSAGMDATVCAGTPTTLDADGATTYNWDNGVGAGETPSVTPTTTTTYTVTGTDANGCQNTDQVVVTVNPMDNATFAYTSNTICDGSPNVTPTTSAAGTFSATPAGLVINATSGEIDVNASTPAAYTVTYTTSGICPNTSTQTITITSIPAADFSYASADYCSGSANPTPTFDPGASAGTFSSTAGLSINSATGEVNIAASTAGTYTVTNAIAASGSCPAASATTTIEINPQPTAAVTGGGTICGTGTSTVTITLTGTAPYDFVYTDGTTPTTVTGHTTNTYTINASANGTYTVTSVSDANCSNVGTGSAQVIVHANPTVSLAAFSTLCSNASPLTLNQGTPAGGTYTGTGIANGVFTPGAAGSTTVTYAYTDANGCSASATGTITVEAAPTVAFPALTAVCSYVAPFALSGATPAGGTYSGPGVTGGNFNPATAGVGIHTLTYTYANTTGALCSASATQTIQVKNCADVEENSLEESLLVFPNPADESVMVSFQSNEAVSAMITMISADGKVVYSNKVAQTNQFNQEINVSGFSAGVYMIQIETAGGSATRRLVVQ